MLIQIVTLPLYYDSLLQGDPRNVIRLAGVLMLVAAVAMLLVKRREWGTGSGESGKRGIVR